MDLLVERDTAGICLQGADDRLLERAACGDDLTLYIESAGYDETIIFGNYVVTGDLVSGLSLPHLNHGDLSDPARLVREPIGIVQYIYDSGANNVFVKDFLDEDQTLTTTFQHNRSYRSYTWHSTRRYRDASDNRPLHLHAHGDQCKLKVHLGESGWIIIKPDIIYFPDRGPDYLIKSSAVLLPTGLAMDPTLYVMQSRRITADERFSLCYLNVSADGRLTIIHKQRFAVDQAAAGGVREGILRRSDEGLTCVTSLHCEHELLLPVSAAGKRVT